MNHLTGYAVWFTARGLLPQFVHERLVAKLGAAGSGIMACKVPVALVVGYGLVQSDSR